MNKLTKFINNIKNRVWVHWSNFRFRKCERFNDKISEEDKVNNDYKAADLVKKLYSKFNYTKDGFDQLWDAVLPPPEAYKRYQQGLLKDDCDGFHSLVYQCLNGSYISCLLLVVTSPKSGHCVLLFNLNNVWHICDYKNIFRVEGKIGNVVEEYNKYYSLHYKTKPVKYNCFIAYNYHKGKFKFLDYDKVTKTVDGIFYYIE